MVKKKNCRVPKGKETRQTQTRVASFLSISTMAQNQLKSQYNELKRSFEAKPSDLKKCGSLLAQLKVMSSIIYFVQNETLKYNRLVSLKQDCLHPRANLTSLTS